jgi:hypothetical protein
MRKERRAFLKLAAGAGVAGVTLGRTRFARAAWPKTGTLEINPNISNTLVVACKDEAMVKGTPTSTTFAAQTSAVESARVAANLDAMAMRLANATTPDAAWKAIFRSSKPWASTRVAIKINVTETRNMPRLAVVEKVCRVIASLGVPAANIIVYDGGPESFASATSNYTPYFSTTDSSKIPGVVSHINDSLGGTTDAPLPDGTTAPCTADIAKGGIDILVNIAINKGHIYYGKASLCMKNHYGTFAPNHDADYLFAINKSDAIVGGTPPRQQLCIVDSLFAIKTYNNAPDTMPCYLVMGTFAPIVDYLTVKKIREEVLKYSHDSSIVDTYPTTFGYTAKDPEWVLVSPGTVSPDAGVAGSGGSGAGGTTAVGGRNGGGGNTAAGGVGGGGGRTQVTGTGGRAGGSTGSGGAGSGGATSPTTGTGGNAGAAGQGGKGGTGGTAGFGGATTGSGGTGGGNAGAGGSAGSGSGGASAAGGAAASTGSTGGAEGKSESGCACHLGDRRRNLGGMATTAVGTFLAARLGKLLFGREESAEWSPKQAGKSDQEAD